MARSTTRQSLLKNGAAGLLSLGGDLEGMIHVQVRGPDGLQYQCQGCVTLDDLPDCGCSRCETVIDRSFCEPPMPAPNPDWQWLSPDEEAIVRLLETADVLTAKQLAARLKLPCSSLFRCILSNLVNRKILVSTSEGYRINLPAS